MEIITLLLIGLSLSIDAFTLSLAYGLLNIPKKKIILISTLVGIFHFIMPLIGYIISNSLNKIIKINYKYTLIIVLAFIVIEMIKSLKEKIEEYNLNLNNIIIFAFLVSFDSLAIGLGIKYITDTILLGSLIFSLSAFIFTYLGFMLGKFMSVKIGTLAKKAGIVILLCVIMYFICK